MTQNTGVCIEGLRQPPFNTTLLGVIRGVADFFGIGVSDVMLYGGSGHAFLINIHEALCPSGPYCWNPAGFNRLLRNLGIERTDHGFFSRFNSEDDRKRLDALLVEHLDRNVPCALLNMENQLITGYDATGFFTTQPWAPCMDFPQKHLTFGTWEEFGDECHVNFYTFRPIEPAPEMQMFADSLEYAVDLFRNPTQHTEEPYGVGPDAYVKWIGAVKNGDGGSHGNWWNATVWAECRSQAAKYCAEIGDKYPGTAAQAHKLTAAYSAIAGKLNQAGDKAMAAEEKIPLLEATAAEEAQCIAGVEELAAALRTFSGR